MDRVERPMMNVNRRVIDVGRPNNVIKAALTIVALMGILAGAITAYIWISGGTAQPSSALTAPSLQVSPTGKLFHISQDQSQVRFMIDEVLLGKANTVIGSTNQVAGDIMVDFAHPEKIQLGIIRINVKTLATDNEFRNRALRGQVLQSTTPDFEFATFVPSKIVGLPDKLMFGQPVTLQLVGQLTIHGVSRDITFDATVSPVTQDRLEGSAKAAVNYKVFNMVVPDAPGVANVAEEVRLEIDFVAISGE